tara:strand:+ start:8 stop:2191 length:2184 start_codon:yes stop_codon:yes gene_type:complete
MRVTKNYIKAFIAEELGSELEKILVEVVPNKAGTIFDLDFGEGPNVEPGPPEDYKDGRLQYKKPSKSQKVTVYEPDMQHGSIDYRGNYDPGYIKREVDKPLATEDEGAFNSVLREISNINSKLNKMMFMPENYIAKSVVDKASADFDDEPDYLDEDPFFSPSSVTERDKAIYGYDVDRATRIEKNIRDADLGPRTANPDWLLSSINTEMSGRALEYATGISREDENISEKIKEFEKLVLNELPLLLNQYIDWLNDINDKKIKQFLNLLKEYALVFEIYKSYKSQESRAEDTGDPEKLATIKKVDRYKFNKLIQKNKDKIYKNWFSHYKKSLDPLISIVNGENSNLQKITNPVWVDELRLEAWRAMTYDEVYSDLLDRELKQQQVKAMLSYKGLRGSQEPYKSITQDQIIYPPDPKRGVDEFIDWFFETNPDSDTDFFKGEYVPPRAIGAAVQYTTFLEKLLISVKREIFGNHESFVKYMAKIQYYFPHGLAAQVTDNELINCKLELYFLNVVTKLFLKYPLKTVRQFTDSDIWQKTKKELEIKLNTKQWGQEAAQTALVSKKNKQSRLFKEVLPAQKYQIKRTGKLKDTNYQWCKKLVDRESNMKQKETYGLEMPEDPVVPGNRRSVESPADSAIQMENISVTISKDYVKDLILEEFTKSDIKDIVDDAIEKQFKKELPSILKKELEKALKSKETKEDVGEIAKKVLKKLYKDLSFHHPYIIDRIKV